MCLYTFELSPRHTPPGHARASPCRAAALTGESMPVEKTGRRAHPPLPPLLDCPNLAFMGTHVASGGWLPGSILPGGRLLAGSS